MRLSLAELKQKSEGIVLGEILESIQGGSENGCHIPPSGSSAPPSYEDVGVCILPGE